MNIIQYLNLDKKNSALLYASENGYNKVIKELLLDSRLDFSTKDVAFCRASRNGYTDVVKIFLMDPKINPSSCYNYPLRASSQNGHSTVVALLLSDSRIMNLLYDNNWILKNAAYNGHSEIVKLLLDSIDLSDLDNDAIRLICKHSNLKVMWVLMSDPRMDSICIVTRIMKLIVKLKSIN